MEPDQIIQHYVAARSDTRIPTVLCSQRGPTAAESPAPMGTRRTLKVVLTAPVTAEAVEPTLYAILKREQSENPNIDEIFIELYSSWQRIPRGWNVAALLWAPQGKRGELTPSIVLEGDRSAYTTDIKFFHGFDKLLELQHSRESRHGLSYEQRRDYFNKFHELDHTLDDAVLDRADMSLMAHHSISPEIHRAIMLEGNEAGW